MDFRRKQVLYPLWRSPPFGAVGISLECGVPQRSYGLHPPYLPLEAGLSQPSRPDTPPLAVGKVQSRGELTWMGIRQLVDPALHLIVNF